MRNIFFVAGEGIFIFVSVLLASVIILGQESFVLNHQLLMKIFLISVFFTILLIGSWRFGYSLILNRGLFNQKIILLGSGDLLKDIKQEISERKDCGYTLTLEAPESMRDVDLTNPAYTPIVCKYKCEGLYEMARTLGIKKVVVDFQERRAIFPTKELLKCRVEGIDVIDSNKFYENLTGMLTVESLNPSGLIFSGGFQKTHLQRFLKRSVDLILSVFMLIVCSPMVVICAVLIKIDSKGPEITNYKHQITNKSQITI